VKRDRLTTRFFVVGGLLALLLTLVCVALLLAVAALRDTSDDATRSATRLFNASRAQRLTVDQETGLRGFLLTGSEALLEPVRTGRGELRSTLTTLRALSAGEGTQETRARRVEAAALAYLRYIDTEVAAGPGRPRAELVRATEAGKTRLDAIRRLYEDYITEERRRADRRNDDAGASATLAGTIGGFGFVLLLAAIPLGLLYLSRAVVAPVRAVGSAARRLADGEERVRAPEAGAGEVGALARSFNSMAAALEVSRTELEQRGVRLGETNRQLRAAYEELERSKQQAILELSTPVLQLQPGLLVLPVIGALDLERAQQLDERLLRAVREHRARVVVIDVTGVPVLESAVALRVLRTVASVRLLGARVLVTGMSAELAQALVALDIDVSALDSFADLQGGVEAATGRRS
jgi:CHASE3 domain sensor protein/anti-anti-sigma regulatory factor